MTTRRTSGPESQAVKRAPSSQAKTVAALAPELFRALPVGVVVLHAEAGKDERSFRIFDLNPAAADIIGLSGEDLRGKSLAEFPGLLKTSFIERCLEALVTMKPCALGEVSYGEAHIREGVYSVQLLPLTQDFLAVAIDNITERAFAEQKVRESEESFRHLVEGVREYALFQLDPEGRVVTWNPGAERLKGYVAEEIIGKHFSVFYPPEDVQSGKPSRNLAEVRQKGQIEDEGWRVHKDGSRFWANVVLTALWDERGDLQGFAKLTRDMSKQRERMESLREAKEELQLRVDQRAAVLLQVNRELRAEVAERERVEERLRMSLEQLRALAARLQHVREEERSNIAREIHDELGQACTAIKMDLALIGRKATKRQTQLRAKVKGAMELADNMIQTLRRIASDLRPRTLDDLGLTAAMEWQAQEFESRTRIPCSLTLPEEVPALDREVSTAIFRIFQESLTNVVRHAQATQVTARLAKEGEALILEVGDNGKGFDTEEVKGSKSLGLVGMQERALLLNGEITIDGVPGAGTKMTLRIPLTASTLPKQDSR